MMKFEEAKFEEYWQAVLNRDRRYDGTFVYGVLSTSIYCKPSCSARKPARGKVVFHPSPESAEKAGFRPCRRCQPENPGLDPADQMVAEICRMIEADPQASLTLADLAEKFHTSPSHLQRTFKKVTGLSPKEYQQATRFKRLRQELSGGKPVLDAILEAGFNSSSSVYEKTRRELGMPPGAYARKGRYYMVTYTVVDCPLGKLLVAGTTQGVCSVKLGSDPRELIHILEEEFGEAELIPDGELLNPWVKAILAYLEGYNPALQLPLDVRGTLFQRQVWRALQDIPYGSTRTYAEVAQAIGKPSAIRAVAGACGANPTALVVPCHRVVRTDGGLGGYHWGIGRKKVLLMLEKGVKNE